MDYSVLQQVTHGAIQFTAYEELRKVFVNYRSRDDETNMNSDNLLVSQLYGFISLEYQTMSINYHMSLVFVWHSFSCVSVKIRERVA